MCVCTKKRKGVAAEVLMASPCTKSLGASFARFAQKLGSQQHVTFGKMARGCPQPPLTRSVASPLHTAPGRIAQLSRCQRHRPARASCSGGRERNSRQAPREWTRRCRRRPPARLCEVEAGPGESGRTFGTAGAFRLAMRWQNQQRLVRACGSRCARGRSTSLARRWPCEARRSRWK